MAPSLTRAQELADKVVEVVEPQRERLDAVCVFPSMPAVMKLNKIGSFTMASMGQARAPFAVACLCATRVRRVLRC